MKRNERRRGRKGKLRGKEKKRQCKGRGRKERRGVAARVPPRPLQTPVGKPVPKKGATISLSFFLLPVLLVLWQGGPYNVCLVVYCHHDRQEGKGEGGCYNQISPLLAPRLPLA